MKFLKHPNIDITKGFGNSKWKHFLITLLIIVVVWSAIVLIFRIPDFLLPPPWQVVMLLVHKWKVFARAAFFTAGGAILGFLLGSLTALLLACIAVVSARLRTLLEPFMVISQTFPVQAVAPLLVVWFGFGILPKIIASGLICFFPLAIAAIHGLTSIDQNLMAVTVTLGATPFQIFTRLRIPSALPFILSALKVSATLSVIGIVIGEFVSPQEGLGYIILSGQAHLQVDAMFASILLLAIIGLSFYSVTALLELSLMKKRRVFKEKNHAIN